jgi:glycosyltransferase involved in cell wall biosynthesis
MKVSICIPCYEMHGKGGEFLSFNLSKILNQTYKNYEVVVSDHSVSNLIKDVCDHYSSMRMDIKYLKNELNRGNSSSNINNAILQSNGEIIKILFQDDFFFHSQSLEDIVSQFSEGGVNWMVTACCHSRDGVNFERDYYPRYTEDIMEGNNLISSPSVLSFLRDENITLFDEKLVWLMDCDIYKRLYLRYGDPLYLNSINVVNRTWDGQFNNHIPWGKKMWEIEYGRQKYKKIKL